MTNEELIVDLKQFIEATISQQMSDVATKDDIKNLDVKINHLDDRITHMHEDVSETLTHITEALDTTEQVQDHERRIRKLEGHTA